MKRGIQTSNSPQKFLFCAVLIIILTDKSLNAMMFIRRSLYLKFRYVETGKNFRPTADKNKMTQPKILFSSIPDDEKPNGNFDWELYFDGGSRGNPGNP